MTMMKVTASEAAVLELRGVPLAALDGCEAAPAWAAHLAAAECADRWGQNAARAFPWPEVWRCAFADNAWQGATNRLVGDGAADERDRFFRAWVDAWLMRTIGMRVYGESLGDAVLRHVKRRVA